MDNLILPLHPKLVHFPIGLFLTALIFELTGCIFNKSRFLDASILIYIFATILTPVVIYSGLLEASRLHLNHPVLSHHKNFAFLSAWISIGSLPILLILKWRFNKIYRKIFILFLFIINISIIFTSFYGGKLVYDYSVGINSSK